MKIKFGDKETIEFIQREEFLIWIHRNIKKVLPHTKLRSDKRHVDSAFFVIDKVHSNTASVMLFTLDDNKNQCLVQKLHVTNWGKPNFFIKDLEEHEEEVKKLAESQKDQMNFDFQGE